MSATRQRHLEKKDRTGGGTVLLHLCSTSGWRNAFGFAPVLAHIFRGMAEQPFYQANLFVLRSRTARPVDDRRLTSLPSNRESHELKDTERTESTFILFSSPAIAAQNP
jgi:hypothetical protein